MDIIYRVSRSDLKDAEKFIGKYTRKIVLNSRRRLILNVVNVVLWMPIGFLVAHHWNHFGKAATAYLVATVVMLQLALWIARRLVEHYNRQLPSEQGAILGEFNASLSDGILHIGSKKLKSETQISELHDLQETEAGVYLFVDTNLAIYIPKSGVLAGTFDSFVSELKAIWSNH